MLVYGWAWHEIVYKRRLGPEPKGKGADGQPLPTSNFSDGKIGWRKLPIRAQETLWQWQLDEADGGIQALVQVAWDGVRRTVPIEKSLLFRTETTRGNPEGRSILRNAFVPWFRKKNIEEIEAIGIERDLAGLPTLAPPEGVNLNSPTYAEVKQAAQDLITAVKRDEDEGILFPTAGWDFKLVTTGGSRQIDTDAIIRRYDQRIATTVLADFILLAQDRVGSYGLADIKVDTFGEAMAAWLGAIAEVLNRYAVPRLLRLNGIAVEEPPKIKPGDPGKADIEQLAQFLNMLSLSGAPDFWSEDLLKSLFELAGLPAPEITSEAPADPNAPERGREPEPAAEGPAEPVTKADDRAREVGVVLARKRAPVLERAMRADVGSALSGIGRELARTYSQMVGKAAPAVDPVAGDRPFVDKLLAAVGLEKIVKDRLGPVYQRHYQRVAVDTLKTIKNEIGLVTDVPDEVARQVIRDGGRRLGMLDIEKQAREAIFKALADGRANGENPLQIARRIEEYVPRGRFTNAGSAYRSQLISRTETLNAQRVSALAAYKSMDNVTAVMLRDGLLADSDALCAARDGDIVSFDEAEALMADEHPLGTLSLSPVVGDPGK